MKERPIIFSSPMVRALLEGRKTQTRRIIKPQPDLVSDDGVPGIFTPEDEKYGRLGKVIKCPYGKPGDRLWVRETWALTGCMADAKLNQFHCPESTLSEYLAHRADCDGYDNASQCWRPSIHMPRWASRITLEITGVRVERLQDISEGDAKAEGIDLDLIKQLATDNNIFGSGCDSGLEFAYSIDPIFTYSALWESINGKGSWDENPWVWVLEFKRVLEND